MLLIARGKGALVPVLIVVSLLPALFLAALGPEALWVSAALGLAAAGVAIWKIGAAANDEDGSGEYRDAQTGARVHIPTGHTFMFIPMQWWAFPVWLVTLIPLFLASLTPFAGALRK